MLAVFREPDTCMFQETDQVQTDQKLRGTPAGALPEPGGDLLIGVGPLTAGPLGRQLLKGVSLSRLNHG